MRNRGRSRRRSGIQQCQLLEDRSLLTNLEVTSAFLVDGQGNQMDDAILGERMGVKVRFTTDQIADTQHRIEFKVDGVVRDVTTTHGAGTWSWTRTGWYATAGNHVVEVIVDADNQIAEDDETDNSFSFTVSTVQGSPPVKLEWPVEGGIQADNYITNFYDVDVSSDHADLHGGPYAYDGHAAWDIGPGHFADMDDGVDVYAAAAGTVTEVNDGEFDRQTDGFNVQPRPAANYVKIDHGQGFETFYWHFRRDSVEVEVGQVVAAGDRLGLMGSSGVSTGTHLHFGLTRHGRPVEPMFDPNTYLADTIPYSDDVTIMRSSGVWIDRPTDHFKEGAPRTNVFPVNSPVPYVWGYFTAINQDDLVETIWHRPDGSQFTRASHNANSDYRTVWWRWSRNLGSNAMPGTWTVDFLINGTKLGEDTFQVHASGAPELTVKRTGALIRHNRYTPVDFDGTSVGGSEAEVTFTASNTGTSPLSISDVSVPEGFEIVQNLPSSLAVDASADLIIKRSTSEAGYAAGEVVIHSDDYDEPMYRFSVEGMVEAAEESLVLGIGLRSIDEGERTIANVRRTGATNADLTVNLSAAQHAGQLTFPASVVIPAGSDYASFWVTAAANGSPEADEFVQVVASATGLSSAMNDVWVADNDVQFRLTAATGGTVVNESGQVDAFEVSLVGQPSANVIFSVTSDDTSEVNVVTSTLLFTPDNWSTPQNVTVIGVDDSLLDGDKNVDVSVAVSFSDDTRYAGLGAEKIAVVNQDNDVAGFTIVESESTAASEGGATDSFSVALDAQPTSNVVVTVVSADETEITVTPSSLLFTSLNWATPQEVVVAAVDDDVLDGDRATVVTVSIDDAASDGDFHDVADQFVTATSIDNEVAAFAVTEIDGTSVNESQGGDSFTVVLNEAPLTDVVLDLSLDIDTEITLDKSSITFTPSNWNSPQQVTVNGVDNNVVDGNRSTTVTIAVNDAASHDAFDSLPDQTVVVATLDDDIATFGIEDVEVNEADGLATFSVSLSQPLDIELMVDVVYSVDSATAADFDGTTDTVTFPAHSTTPMEVTVAVTDDNLIELSETLVASLAINAATPAGDRMVDVSATATGTITDNDTAVFSIADVSVNESDGTAEFQISLSNPIDTDVSVDVAYLAHSAVVGDFDGTTDTVIFPGGSTESQKVTVAIADNDVVQLAKTFTAFLAISASSPVGSRAVDLSDTATGTIADDDMATFTLNDLTVNEGDGTATLDVLLSNPLDVDVMVDVTWATAGAGDSDFDAAIDTVSFAAGSRVSQSVTVTITDDGIVEGAETFAGSLSVNTGDSLGTRTIDVSDTATVEIVDNDKATFTIGDVEVDESAGSMEFTVQLDHPVDIPVLVDVRYSDGTATGGTDFDSADDMVTFAALSTAPQTVAVTITDDTIAESAETFIASLALRGNAFDTYNIDVSNTATATIVDDDMTADVDGDDDFDANDSFLIHLIKLSGADVQVDQSKGASPLSAGEIRRAIDSLEASGDVDGDGDFDANDSFLIHLVKLSGTNAQLDQSKGASQLSAAQIRANVDGLGTVASGSGAGLTSARNAFSGTSAQHFGSQADRRLFDDVQPNGWAEEGRFLEELTPTDHDVERVMNDFRSWVDRL